MRELQDIELDELRSFYNSLTEEMRNRDDIAERVFHKCILKEKLYAGHQPSYYYYDGKFVMYSLLFHWIGNTNIDVDNDFSFTINKLRKIIIVKERKEKISKLLK